MPWRKAASTANEPEGAVCAPEGAITTPEGEVGEVVSSTICANEGSCGVDADADAARSLAVPSRRAPSPRATGPPHHTLHSNGGAGTRGSGTRWRPTLLARNLALPPAASLNSSSSRLVSDVKS